MDKQNCNEILFNLKKKKEDFLGGPVDGDPPATAGDIGSIPGLGRSHMVRIN